MNMTKFFVSTLLILGTGVTLSAQALDIKTYSPVALAAAQNENKPVAVHFHADWCPTCRAQAKVLEDMKMERGLALTVLVANYDTEKELKRGLQINAQSTLVVFKGQRETARLVGETSAVAIRSALKSAL